MANFMTEGTMSSNKTDWATPKALFELLDGIFGFTLDPCSNEHNYLVEKHYTEAEDGLTKSWSGERVFMNPPYGADIGKWCEKARLETSTGGGVRCWTFTSAYGHQVVARQRRRNRRCGLHQGKAQIRRWHAVCTIPICCCPVVGTGTC